MAITVGCVCGWATDIETISETNPRRCPQCGGEIVLSGHGELTDQPLYVDGEYNPCLYEDQQDE
jgi:DNA-directed RNA polymerase subunit RPC12/RpoP